MKKLEGLAGSKKGMTSIRIGEEPEELIEDIATRIAIEIQMEAEEQALDDNTEED